ncbi:MAG: type II secretion system F family protein [Nitrospirae bacterium]|nr:type II secretion system F family protein [Nitrospirota bacterium]
MTTYVYVARTGQGVVKKGELAARSRDEAMDQLKKQRLTITSLKQKEGGPAWWDIALGSGVKDKDIVVFTRQFGTMINAGLPLIQCLEILSTQSENKHFGKTVGEVRFEVEAGTTLAEGLRKHPKVFDELYVNLVQAGEASGQLDAILTRLAKHIEKAMKLKNQIKGAMIYPAAIISVAVIVITVLMIWVIPVFARMFAEMSGGKAGLPGPTQLVIDLSNFMQANIVYMVIAALGAVYALKRYYATEKGRLVLDKTMLKTPVFGDLLRKASVAKFTRTLGTLISSGVPILDGLAITSRTAGNKIVELAILDARQSISEGKTVAAPLEKSQVFPPMVTHMISVGETTGALDAMLGKIADFYDDEVDVAVAALTSLLEPVMMVFLGTIIGFIVIAMYLPIFKLASVIN